MRHYQTAASASRQGRQYHCHTLKGAFMTTSPLLPWSYSRLSKYERCPAQAKYAYTLKRPYVQGPAAERGSAAHKTIEDFLMFKTEVVHEAIHPYKHVLDSLRINDPYVEFEIAVD